MAPNMFTVADIKYILDSTLKSWILQGHTSLGTPFQVIDVRDSDYVGGHIINSLHIESNKFKNEKSAETLSNLLKKLRENGQETVVFHCMLSQQRGPSSAMRFSRYLNERINASNDEDELAFIENIKIYVLRGGFGRWQQEYGEDPQLTENYAKDVWKYGY
ncbi:hypothetical protein PMKS-004078 [Pichia membranifaciens]|uniref:Rhodanese domain-containing protein n=1 Tax=Pichia membranifaciens TaxID=4926 RepID=A0A1Q2YLZ8_9ASCO|nr:hypothetical protein PMKS-004078 [Pichia membranifaciens]